MKYEIEAVQRHVVYVDADSKQDAAKIFKKMNDVEVSKAETYKGDMEIENIRKV